MPDLDLVYLDSNRQEAKKHAILNLTSSMETIQAKPRGIDQAAGWCKATKMAQKRICSLFSMVKVHKKLQHKSCMTIGSSILNMTCSLKTRNSGIKGRDQN